MSSVTQGNNSYAFNYNGLGDRLQQTVNGQATNYTLDLNAGLTQVLDDGTNTYTYGLDRISQQHGSTAEYFLGDALGSVRQLSDASDEVTLSKSYDPYGNVISSAGSSASIFGYTNEQADPSGLQYLRARYYASDIGRFITEDPFPGYVSSPQSQNPYAYAINNPIRYSDPTGQCISIHFSSELIISVYCDLADLVIDAVNPETTKLLGPDATDFWGLVLRGMLHFPYANITGQGLQSIKNDPRIIQAQNETIQDIQRNPLYGREEFTPRIKPINVELGKHGGMIQNALSGDQNFWMVYSAMLHVDSKVSADRRITTTWEIQDSFDFEPDWFGHTRTGWNYWQYNVIATIFGWGFYDSILHGAPNMPTTATWTTITYPEICSGW